MEVKVDHDRKLVEFWLTKADQEDASLGEYLRQQYRVCKEKNYIVAQFRSGTEDLYGLTRELLLYNRKRAAQVEIQKEKTGKNPSYTGSVAKSRPFVKQFSRHPIPAVLVCQ